MLVVMLCFWEVCTCGVHANQYAMLSWIWFIVDIVDSYVVLSCLCWYHAHALSLHHVILSWLSIFAFKFNRIKLSLNICWLSHGATISNWPMQPRLPLWEGPNWVYCRASRRCFQRGKVMGVRYPGPVSRHNLVCPLLLLWIRSAWGTYWPWRWSLCLW